MQMSPNNVSFRVPKRAHANSIFEPNTGGDNSSTKTGHTYFVNGPHGTTKYKKLATELESRTSTETVIAATRVPGHIGEILKGRSSPERNKVKQGST